MKKSSFLIAGKHAVTEALRNPNRKVLNVLLTEDSKKKLNTFVSLFPASRPNYVLLVMLDEPKPAPNFIYEFPPSEKFPNGYKYKGETRNTSGWNTVVVAGKIIEKIGPILAINNLEASTKF